MSDFERVQIDAQQFATLGHKLDTLAARIGPANSEYHLHQVLTHLETTLNRIATAMSGGDNSQVLNAINNLTNLVEEKFMGLKEDNEALNDRLGKVDEATNAVAADVTALKEELKTLNENTNIDLGPAIAKAEGIAARLTGIAGPNAGSDPETPAEGGDTGGTNG